MYISVVYRICNDIVGAEHVCVCKCVYRICNDIVGAEHVCVYKCVYRICNDIVGAESVAGAGHALHGAPGDRGRLVLAHGQHGVLGPLRVLLCRHQRWYVYMYIYVCNISLFDCVW